MAPGSGGSTRCAGGGRAASGGGGGSSLGRRRAPQRRGAVLADLAPGLDRRVPRVDACIVAAVGDHQRLQLIGKGFLHGWSRPATARLPARQQRQRRRRRRAAGVLDLHDGGCYLVCVRVDQRAAIDGDKGGCPYQNSSACRAPTRAATGLRAAHDEGGLHSSSFYDTSRSSHAAGARAHRCFASRSFAETRLRPPACNVARRRRSPPRDCRPCGGAGGARGTGRGGLAAAGGLAAVAARGGASPPAGVRPALAVGARSSRSRRAGPPRRRGA